MALTVDIRKRLGDFSLEVSFTAEEGRITGLLGASGCGKSLTLRCIAGVETPDEGHIELNGRVLFDSAGGIDLSPRRRQVGCLFQSLALFPHMTAAQNIAAGAPRLPRPARRQAVAEQLRLFRLEDQARLRPGQLSGGQRQRCALARILIGSPAALLLDEPFSALDSALRWELELELAERLEGFGGPVVFVSHSQEEVRRLCRRICVLEAGRSEPALPAEVLFAAPPTLAACRLAGWRNILPASRLGPHRVSCLGRTLAVDAPVPENCRGIAVRPEHLSLADGPGENVLPCRLLSLAGGELALRPLDGGPPLVLPLPAAPLPEGPLLLRLPAAHLLPLP